MSIVFFPVIFLATRRLYLLVGVLLLGKMFSLQAAMPTPSPEGAFVLNGADALSTFHFSRILSAYEKQFYSVTGYAPAAVLPIVVVLHDPVAEELAHPRLSLDVVEGNLPKIQVDLIQGDRLNAEGSMALAQAMLLREYYDGKAPAPGSHIAEFPGWLLHGMGRLCDPNAPNVVIPSSFLRGSAPPSIDGFLMQKAPDVANASLLEVYDAMASLLLSAGFKSDGGSAGFRQGIGHFDPMISDKEPGGWPSSWEMESVERRWLLLMAGMSGQEQDASTLLGVEETMSRYRAIMGEVPTPDHSLALLKKTKGGDFLARELSDHLTTLRLQANPLTIPLLDQTIQLCAGLKHFSVKKIAGKEKGLTMLSDETLKRAHAIDSYLDWYEAARLPVPSGTFDALLHTPESPVKKGPVGLYIDAVEERGW